jgi:hypothetical protein
LVAAGVLSLILLQTIGRRFKRSLANQDIAFWLISQRMLPPVAVVIPIYVLFQRLGLLDMWVPTNLFRSGASSSWERRQGQTDHRIVHLEQGVGTPMLTSDYTEALEMGHRIIVMRRGRICREYKRGEPEESDILHEAIGEVSIGKARGADQVAPVT